MCKSTNSRVHQHVHHHQTTKFRAHEIILFHSVHKDNILCSFGMEAAWDKKKEWNFLQLHRLVLASTRVLRAKFDSFVPPGTTLQQRLQAPNQAKCLKKANLSPAQLSLIKRSPNSEQFDITLLISLFRHVCYTSKADRKNPLWDEQDNKNISDQSDIADIARIRNLRNEVSMLKGLVCVSGTVLLLIFLENTCRPPTSPTAAAL